MKPFALLAAVGALVAGCSTGSGVPRAVIPEARVDFGDVPVVTNMQDAPVKRFFIVNEGTADLKLGRAQVKVLEGC